MRLNKVQGRRARLLYRPWGFDLGAIRCPHVHVWHGPLDRNVSIETGRAIADAVSGSRSHFRPTDADLSVAINYGEEILEALLVERAGYRRRGATADARTLVRSGPPI